MEFFDLIFDRDRKFKTFTLIRFFVINEVITKYDGNRTNERYLRDLKIYFIKTLCTIKFVFFNLIFLKKKFFEARS